MLRFVVLFALMLGLSGCASLSKEQCVGGDWRDIGQRDGRQGYKPGTIDEHSKSCAEYGVRPDRNAYKRGYNEGIAVYCKPENGRRLGESGNYYNRVCPTNMEDAFMRQYSFGRQLYQAQGKINSTLNDIQIKEDRLRIEKNPAIRTSLRREISALDDLVRTLQRNYSTLRNSPPHH